MIPLFVVYQIMLLDLGFEELSYHATRIRFTKVLTKYSTEYNNSLFLQDLSKFLSMDKKDTISFFKYLRNNFTIENIQDILELYEINTLEINRIYRYIDKNNKNCSNDKINDIDNNFHIDIENFE